MTTHATSAPGRTPYRSGVVHRTLTNPATLVAVTLFLAVLIAEAVPRASPTSARWPRSPGACRDHTVDGTAGPAGRVWV